MVQNLRQDLTYATRQLRRSPGFAITAVLTLGLGIGATTAMYSIVRSTLLAPLPYPHADELAGVGFSHPGEDPNHEQTGETGNLVMANAKSFSSVGMADDGPLGANFSSSGIAARSIQTLRVSSGYLPTLGIAPLLGHSFTREEDTPGAAPTAVLSEAFWRSSLHADPQIVGRVIHINADPFTVIGVMPATLATVDSPDLWQPLHLSAADPGYQGTNFQMIGRLKPGLTWAQASAELNGLTQAIYREFPDYKAWVGPGVPVPQEFCWPLRQIVVSDARSSILVLSAAVLAVLLMACLNLAGLMTARAIARRSEMALRQALGAGRSRTLLLMLGESWLLTAAGTALGIGLATVAVPLLLRSSPVALPQLQHATVDVPVAIFAALVGCLSMLLFGLVPAVAVSRSKSGGSLGSARIAGESVSNQRLGKSLLVAQVALATTLLSAAALLLSTFLHMRAIPSGVRPEHLYALQVNLKGQAYSSALHTQQFMSHVEERLRQIPGVEQVATVNGLPLDRGLNGGAGPANDPQKRRNSEIRFVTPAYFRTVGTMLLEGDDMSESDTAASQPVALINELAAQRWFPGRPAIGEYVSAAGKQPRRVIGVTANVRNQSVAGSLRPTVYVPYTQISDDVAKMLNGWFATTFVLRVAEHDGMDAGIGAAAASAVTEVDPEVPAAKFAPMQGFIDKSVAAPRFFSWLAGGFAAFALLLTAIGLFGLLSYQVASRTRELGVRMALGAQRAQVLGLVLRNGLWLTSAGLVMGACGGFALRGVIGSLVFQTVEIQRSEVSSLLGSQNMSVAIAAGAMLMATLFASLIPASRAANIDPMEALRNE